MKFGWVHPNYQVSDYESPNNHHYLRPKNMEIQPINMVSSHDVHTDHLLGLPKFTKKWCLTPPKWGNRTEPETSRQPLVKDGWLYISIASWDFLEFSSTMKIDPTICELWSFPALIAYTRDRKTVRIVQRKQQTYPISLCLTLCSSPSPCLHAERFDYVYIVYIYIYTYT